MKKTLWFLLMFLVFTSCALAWKITPELKDEIKKQEQVVRENPYNADAHFNLGMVYAYSNEIKKGWEELVKVNELDPKFSKFALKKYSRLVAKNPDDWRLRYRLAFSLRFTDQRDKAIEEFKIIQKLNPQEIFASGYIGLMLGEMNRVDEAIATIQEAVKKDNDVAALHLLLSEAYFRKGEKWKGASEAMEAIRLKTLGY